MKCAAGGGGDGDRIGGEWSALALFKLDARWKCYSIARTLSLVPDPPKTRIIYILSSMCRVSVGTNPAGKGLPALPGWNRSWRILNMRWLGVAD